MDCLSKKAAEKMLGAIIMQPHLAACIPCAIQTQLSPYGHFILKACAESWGIAAIQTGLNEFGLDGDNIVSESLNAVRGDPASTFWLATRHLCRAVIP